MILTGRLIFLIDIFLLLPDVSLSVDDDDTVGSCCSLKGSKQAEKRKRVALWQRSNFQDLTSASKSADSFTAGRPALSQGLWFHTAPLCPQHTTSVVVFFFCYVRCPLSDCQRIDFLFFLFLFFYYLSVFLLSLLARLYVIPRLPLSARLLRQVLRQNTDISCDSFFIF